MTKKFRVWLDSGANIHSKYQQEVELDMSEEEWNVMTDLEKDEYMREIAFSNADWGYIEI